MPIVAKPTPQKKMKNIGSAYVRMRFLFHATHVRIVIITLERRAMNQLDIFRTLWTLTLSNTQSNRYQD